MIIKIAFMNNAKYVFMNVYTKRRDGRKLLKKKIKYYINILIYF